eukprot:GHVN01075552.1.p1 GENE.GHVN01075552.1~~GHVN01075552.1.p1  ORF type:complete len:132 (-),score=46.21 GHVN01075552.1:294-689(-)
MSTVRERGVCHCIVNLFHVTTFPHTSHSPDMCPPLTSLTWHVSPTHLTHLIRVFHLPHSPHSPHCTSHLPHSPHSRAPTVAPACPCPLSRRSAMGVSTLLLSQLSHSAWLNPVTPQKCSAESKASDDTTIE